MNLEGALQEVLGEEFDVRFDSKTRQVEIGLRLSGVISIGVAVLENNPTHEIIRLERDRLLIEFKRKLTVLLWKYLGDIGRDY